MAERVRAGVIDVRMNDRGRRQRVPRRMTKAVRQRAGKRQRGPRWNSGRRWRRNAAFFRALRQGRRRTAVRPWIVRRLVHVQPVPQGHQFRAQAPQTLLEVHRFVRRRGICNREPTALADLRDLGGGSPLSGEQIETIREIDGNFRIDGNSWVRFQGTSCDILTLIEIWGIF